MREYDIVIVGGGIQGTGVAQAAVAAGHTVLLLEKTALAAGTSSRSSKLIHGGLRYLESAEISLVRECLTERAILLRNAPDLVRMRKFILPIYRRTRRRPWQIRIGLTLYSLLANLRKQARAGRIPRAKWDTLDGLRTDGLQAVFYYPDAQTDDAQLTAAVMRSACSLGAELALPGKMIAARLHSGGCEVDYVVGQHELTCQARVLINAAGPWINQVADVVTPAPRRLDIELVQGAHIVLDGRVTKGIYYTESPRDGRAVFIMPWKNRLMVGTTETQFSGDPENTAPTASEKSYLLSVLRNYFPAYADKTVADIRHAFAGLRVLQSGSGHAFHRTRDVIYKTDRSLLPRYLAIYGGKLTAYRATAEHIYRRIRPSLPERLRRADTRELPLTPD